MSATNPPGWILHVYSMELRKVLSYRVDFWVQFLGTLFTDITISYFLWMAVYAGSGTTRIGGYTFAGMMTYYVLLPLVNRVVRGSDIGFFSPEIYDGSLTRYLVYPVPYFGYKYLSYLALSTVALLQLVIMTALFKFGVGPFFHLSLGETLGGSQLLLGMVAAVASSFVYFSAMGALEMLAFWNDAVWTVLVMLRFSAQFLGGGLVPLSLFPAWSRPILDWLPFQYMIAFPVRVMMGETSPAFVLNGLLACAFWGSVFLGAANLLWRRGSYQYSGVGI